ncbi:hypothetical protein [Romboutsia lituseburensis]|uniref:hypothetical protein n=1 Tax=Romboutsia lituseburensis TaxID=1537 RepID=UPI0022EA1ECD|nr:hypothetical protein [Romboutsia lituseburensis]
MNISREYINKTRKYLIKLDGDMQSIEFIKKEIEYLKERDFYQEINIEKAIFKSNSNYGIDDKLVYIKDQIDIKEGEIAHILRKFEEINLFLNQLTNIERDIILYKYFNRKEDNSKYRNKDIEDLLKYSISSIKRIEKKVIEKLAIFKYGKEIIICDDKEIS